MLIRVRDDDVLVHSSQYKDSFARFQEIHGWMLLSPDILHVPAILVQDIQQYPSCIAYCREQAAEGRMLAEIHGWTHHDYGRLPKTQVYDEILRAKEWVSETFGRVPEIWYTPWGSSQPHLHEVASELNLRLVDTSRTTTLEGKSGIIRRLVAGLPIEQLNGIEIFWHWWTAGARLLRLCKAVEAGSWAAAAEANPKLFNG